jgi:hypothetical protein
MEKIRGLLFHFGEKKPTAERQDQRPSPKTRKHEIIAHNLSLIISLEKLLATFMLLLVYIDKNHY